MNKEKLKAKRRYYDMYEEAVRMMTAFVPDRIPHDEFDLEVIPGKSIDLMWGDILYRQYDYETKTVRGFFENNSFSITDESREELDRMITWKD